MDDLPNIRNLIDIYKKIKECKLVQEKKVTAENMAVFVSLINSSLNGRSVEYQTFRYLYLANPNGFFRYIRDSNAEHMILWTESKIIVRWFDLRDYIYLDYDRKMSRYHIQERERSEEYTETKSDSIPLRDLGLGSTPGDVTRILKSSLPVSRPSLRQLSLPSRIIVVKDSC